MKTNLKHIIYISIGFIILSLIGVGPVSALSEIDPAEEAIRTKMILCNVFSFKDKTYIPVNEKRLTMEVAIIIFIKLDNLFSLPYGFLTYSSAYSIK